MFRELANGDHRTLASICPVRKKIIKEETKKKRTRSRSRSRSRPTEGSYAEVTRGPPNQGPIRPTPQTHPFPKLPDNFAAVVFSALAFSHYMEAKNPGTFQANMDAMYKENNIPLVKFPHNIDTSGVFEFLEKVIINVPIENSDTANEANREISEEEIEEREDEADMEAEEETAKRARSDTPPPQPPSKKQVADTSKTGKSSLPPQVTPPMPPPPTPVGEGARTRAQQAHQMQQRAVPQRRREKRDSTSQTHIPKEEVERMGLRLVVANTTKTQSNLTNKDKLSCIRKGIYKFDFIGTAYEEDEIIAAINNNQIDITNAKVHIVSQETFNAFQSGHKQRQQTTARKSSTTDRI